MALQWTDFETKLGTWASRFKPFFDKGGFDDIYEHLKKESRRGKKIVPLSAVTFRCFIETPFDDVRVVLCGLSPYHTFRKMKPVADGLLLGCSVNNFLQPPLEKFYEAIERECYGGLNMHYVKNPDVSYLANRGVLMLNAALTTEMHKAGSHAALWKPFMEHLFAEILSGTGAPVVFLGKEAARLKQYVMPFTWTFELTHPASASYTKTDWDTEKVFTSLNKILKDSNGETIEWLDVQIFEDMASTEENVPF